MASIISDAAINMDLIPAKMPSFPWEQGKSMQQAPEAKHSEGKSSSITPAVSKAHGGNATEEKTLKSKVGTPSSILVKVNEAASSIPNSASTGTVDVDYGQSNPEDLASYTTRR